MLPAQTITLEDVFSHTSVTYANTWVREMTGAEIKNIMEDVADNLFHPDPYYRQGGDMVRMGGLSYAIDPRKPMGSRIADVTVRGRLMDPGRKYKATGWASRSDVAGPPIYDVVAAYLRNAKRVRIAPSGRVRVV